MIEFYAHNAYDPTQSVQVPDDLVGPLFDLLGVSPDGESGDGLVVGQRFDCLEMAQRARQALLRLPELALAEPAVPGGSALLVEQLRLVLVELRAVLFVSGGAWRPFGVGVILRRLFPPWRPLFA